MPDLPLILWLVIAGLGYTLVTCMLGTLAAMIRNGTERHDLMVAARQRYLEHHAPLQPDVEADVEVVTEPAATEPVAQVGQPSQRRAA